LCAGREQLHPEAGRLRAVRLGGEAGRAVLAGAQPARAPAGLTQPAPYSCSARWNRIQLVAMTLSPPSGRLPRWVWVNAVGAISSVPVLGTILRCWSRNSVSPAPKPSLR